jgi:hypothetical protein
MEIDYLLHLKTLTVYLPQPEQKGNAFCLLSHYPFNLRLGFYFYNFWYLGDTGRLSGLKMS